MESKLWEKLLHTLEDLKPDIPKLSKKRNRYACDRIRKNTWKAIKYLRALNGLANTY